MSEVSFSVVYRKNLSMIDPSRPSPCRRFSYAYISETVDPISTQSPQGDRPIQATLIKVELGSFEGGGSACRVKGVKICR